MVQTITGVVLVTLAVSTVLMFGPIIGAVLSLLAYGLLLAVGRALIRISGSD